MFCATDGHTCSEYELEFSSENSNLPSVDSEFLFSLDSIEVLQKALKNAKDESRLTLNFRQQGEYRTGFFEFIAKGGNVCLCFNESVKDRLLITKPEVIERPLESAHRRILMGQRKD